MQYILTGTVCPFPYTWPATMNGTTNPADWTVTYAQALGVRHIILQVAMFIVSVPSFLAITFRIYKLKKHTEAIKTSLIFFPSFEYFLLAFIFSASIALDSFDLYAFRVWYPPAMFYLLEDIASASMASIAIVMMEFWARLAPGMGNRQSRAYLKYTKAILICTIYLDFVGFGIADVVDTERFELHHGSKRIIASLLVLLSFVKSSASV